MLRVCRQDGSGTEQTVRAVIAHHSDDDRVVRRNRIAGICPEITEQPVVAYLHRDTRSSELLDGTRTN